MLLYHYGFGLLEGWVGLIKFRRNKLFKNVSLLFKQSTYSFFFFVFYKSIILFYFFFTGQRIYDSKLIPLLICCYNEYQRANEFFCFTGYDLHLVWITWSGDVKTSIGILWSDFFIFTACRHYLLHPANTGLPHLLSVFSQVTKWQGVSRNVKATMQICRKC